MGINRYIRDIILIMIVLIILTTPLFYWLSIEGNWNKRSSLEARPLTVFPLLSFRDFKTATKRIFQGLYLDAYDIFFNQILNQVFQVEVNLATADQFPQRNIIAQASRNFERNVINLAYAFHPDSAIPAAFESKYEITRDKCCLIPTPRSYDGEDQEYIRLRIENYRELIEKYPEINFFVYNIDEIAYSDFHPSVEYYPNADRGRSLQYFLENKPENLEFANFGISDFNDHKVYFYRTDNHWNIRGAIKAYKSIYELLRRQFPDISPIVKIQTIKPLEGIELLGSYARATLYPISPDIFEYAEVEIPPYHTVVNSKETVYGYRQKYLDGYRPYNKYENIYGGFYGTWKALIEYYFENDSDRNLLLITSSHSRMIQMYIASHYRSTYIIDRRTRAESVRSIPLSKMIEDYEINDVLILGQPSVTYLSDQHIIFP